MNILGTNYKIRFAGDWSREDPAMGRCDTKWAEITLGTLLPKDVMNSTLIHETVHAINGLLDVGLDEKQIAALSTGFHSVFGKFIDFDKLLKEE